MGKPMITIAAFMLLGFGFLTGHLVVTHGKRALVKQRRARLKKSLRIIRGGRSD